MGVGICCNPVLVTSLSEHRTEAATGVLCRDVMERYDVVITLNVHRGAYQLDEHSFQHFQAVPV